MGWRLPLKRTAIGRARPNGRMDAGWWRIEAGGTFCKMTRRQRLRYVFFCTVWMAICCTSFAAPHVVNAGVPGESSGEMATRMGAALERYRPSLVVIFAGMNDAVNNLKFQSPRQTMESVTAMVKRAQLAHAKVVLVNLHEPDERRLLARHKIENYGSIAPAERIRAVNRELLEVSRQSKVPLADFHEALKQAGGANEAMSTDGVHLTARGYHLLAVTVLKALPERLDEDATVLCMGDSLTYGIGVRKPGRDEGNETYPAQLQSLLR